MARARSKKAAPIRFRGAPFALSGVVAEAVDPLIDILVKLKIPKSRGGPIEAMATADVDPRVLRLTLPPDVAPGRYDAVATIEGEEVPAVVEVEPQPGLRVFPESLRIDAHAGDLVGVDVSVLNTGNVPIEMRTRQAFGIFLEGGLERALRQAYVARLEEGVRRIDVLAETLADSHGGLVKLKVTRGSGEIPPGELREVEMNLSVPAGLKPGHTYSGNWELASLVYPVRIAVAGKRAESPEDDDSDDREETVK